MALSRRFVGFFGSPSRLPHRADASQTEPKNMLRQHISIYRQWWWTGGFTVRAAVLVTGEC